MTEIHIHFHSDRERAALGQIDENLDHPDIGEAALVAPIEFTLKKDDYAALGGHMDFVRPLAEVLKENERQRQLAPLPKNPWPLRSGSPEAKEK